MLSIKFKSNEDYTASINKIKKVKSKLNDAKKLYDDGKEDDAVIIWKEIFGKEFPIADVEEAKNHSKSLSEGTLKVTSTGILSSAIGKIIPASGGFHGEEEN